MLNIKQKILFCAFGYYSLLAEIQAPMLSLYIIISLKDLNFLKVDYVDGNNR